MMLNELKILLKQLNLPVAYNHFKSSTKPPYIVYLVTETQNIFADNVVVKKQENINIELYTKEKDVKLEENLENLLNNNELPYEIEGELFIEEENVYQIIYQITI